MKGEFSGEQTVASLKILLKQNLDLRLLMHFLLCLSHSNYFILFLQNIYIVSLRKYALKKLFVLADLYKEGLVF